MKRKIEIMFHVRDMSDRAIVDRAKLLFYLNMARLGVNATVTDAELLSGGSMYTCYAIDLCLHWNDRVLGNYRDAVMTLQREYSSSDEGQLTSGQMAKVAETARIAAGEFIPEATMASALAFGDDALSMPFGTVLAENDLDMIRTEPTAYAVVRLWFDMPGNKEDQL